MRDAFDHYGLGIDVGSANVKACFLVHGQMAWTEVRAHDGDLRGTVRDILRIHRVPAGVPTVVTGQEGRRHFAAGQVIPPVAIERALQALDLDVESVVSVGGEDLVVYTVEGGRRIVNVYAGNKCASGTGEFFAQQLKRMGLELSDVDSPCVSGARVCKLSSRCSVFMKSDCTHKLNKGEATRQDIALSLSGVMAGKVLEFLAKARIDGGRVLLIGGSTANPHLVRGLREGLPRVEFVVPDQAPYFEAFGAAYLAGEQGRPLPHPDDFVGESRVAYPVGRPLAHARDLVRFAPPRRGSPRPGAAYVLGIDGGSTTTKVALVDVQTREIAASHYGRTLGDPVAALKRCLTAIRDQLGSASGVAIRLVAATGSSRELLGVFCQTPAIYNEIIAHTAGTAFIDAEVDTIFEIGGQDAKYVFLRNRVPVDYAMNEACSAGTGSFLEESAAGDLDLARAEDIGPMALTADAPLRFGEHCSAFINSDIRKAIQQGATRPNIVAGLVLSIAANYLNRVVGNRRVGRRIALQGGVAKNPAVPLAFASLLGKPVTVPPDPELMGCLGVSLIALEKLAAGALEAREVSLDALIDRRIAEEREYRCHACANDCPIRILRVDDRRYHFGGRCNKFTNLRRKVAAGAEGRDWVEERRRLYFEKYAPSPEDLLVGRVPLRTQREGGAPTVAVPRALSVYSLWPLYASFLHAMGARVRLVTECSEQGVARCESAFCHPAQIAHGVAATALRDGADFLFLPHLKAMPTYEQDVHACLCPIMQALPYYLRTALSIDDARLLAPVLDFGKGLEAGRAAMVEVAARLGVGRAEAETAYALAVERQRACEAEGRRIGARVLEEARAGDRPVIVLFGRPYNAFAGDANMGLPRKFTTRGYTVLPYDFLPIGDERILPNMYWYYGQQDLKGAVQVKEHPNLFACYVTNFGCAPDSFILHYLRWIANAKPFLVTEIDSHTADAGLDTRIEAFLDIIEGYRRARPAEPPATVDQRDWDIVLGGREACVIHRGTGERRDLRDPRVRLIWPSMGGVATEIMAQMSRSYGIDAVALSPADIHTAARARAVASGKECIPALLVLGSFLEYFARHPVEPDRVYLLFMPLTTGPCRTGQYATYYQNLFQEMGYRNVLVLSLSSDNSYAELGADFNKRAWWAVLLGDYLRDIELSLRTLARDPAAAQAEFDAIRREVVAATGRGTGAVARVLPRCGERLGRIPLKQTVADARKALIVGEIFVRRDDYSVETLIANLVEQGIVPKVTGLSEWIHYLNWDEARRCRKGLRSLPPWKRTFSPLWSKLAYLKIEMAWKRWIEWRVRKDLSRSGLVPRCPEGMDRIMSRADDFPPADLESEASLSPRVAAAAMEEGYDGVAIIAPFGCLPGRIIEATYAPWARSRGLPVLALESDGNPYPPSVVSRIDIFAHHVRRGIRGSSTEDLQARHSSTPRAAAAAPLS